MGYAESFPSFSYSVDDIKEQRWVQPVFCKKSKALYTLSSTEVMPLSRTELNNGAKKFKNEIKYNSVVTNWNCDMGQQTGSLCACIKYVCNTYHFQSFGPLGILHFKFFNGYLDIESLIFLIVLKDKTSCWILVDTFYFVERTPPPFFFF